MASVYSPIVSQNVQAIADLTQAVGANITLALAAISFLQPEWPKDADVKSGDKFDFIVAGAGAAGAIVATRLAENPNYNVLLLEAGGDPPLESLSPTTTARLTATPVDWNYTVLYNPEEDFAKKNPAQTILGKMLGGSSTNQYMNYARGNRLDYDNWAKEFPGWDFNTVLPYFKKLENMLVEDVLNDPILGPYHSNQGPIKVTTIPLPDILEQKIRNTIDSWSEIGVKELKDYNGPDQFGIGKAFFTQTNPEPNGIRSDTARDYLVPNKNKANLKILKNAYVTRVLIENKTAKGVDVVVNGNTLSFYSNKEVIVSAGAINTVKILVASGIGPSADLAKLNIDVVADLPVGYHLEDHASVPVFMAGHDDLETNLATRTPYVTIHSNPNANTQAFFSTVNAASPDIQITNIFFGVSSPYLYGVCNSALAIKKNICDVVVESNLIHENFYGDVVLLTPKSEGRVTVPSVDPAVQPVIDTKYFSDPEDLKTMRAALRKFASLGQTKYFKDNSFMIDIGLENCPAFNYDSDEYLDCYIKSMSHSLFHYSGTAPMGKVVDTNLKVYGVENLRVVDTSVFPTIPSGNPFAPVAMVAERISDIIKADHPVVEQAVATKQKPKKAKKPILRRLLGLIL